MKGIQTAISSATMPDMTRMFGKDARVPPLMNSFGNNAPPSSVPLDMTQYPFQSADVQKRLMQDFAKFQQFYIKCVICDVALYYKFV
jgi:hypothetical protein